MDITLTLPDELGERAKKEFPRGLSAILRSALETELARVDAVNETTDEAIEWVLDLETDEGRRYKGRLQATLVLEGRNDTQLFLADDERVMLYDRGNLKIHDLTDADQDVVDGEIRAISDSDEDFVYAMTRIGHDPIVDL